MPKIVFKELTLNDQAYIIKYNHRDTFYLRIKREGKRYTNVSLKTEDLDVAKKNALATYMEIASEPAKSRTEDLDLTLLAMSSWQRKKSKHSVSRFLRDHTTLTLKEFDNELFLMPSLLVSRFLET